MVTVKYYIGIADIVNIFFPEVLALPDDFIQQSLQTNMRIILDTTVIIMRYGKLIELN